MPMEMRKLIIRAAAIAFIWTNASVLATTIDVSGAGASGDIQSTKIFHVDLNESSGTGLFEPFVRIQGNGDQQGYNTDGTVQFDTKSDPHTHSLLLNRVPVVKIGGILYREFALDMGEPGNDTSEDHFLDLSEGQFLLAATSDQSPTTFSAGVLDISGTPAYRLDSNTDNKVILGDLTSGNGRIDYLWYIPSALFGSDENQFLYFYSANERSDGSFEEWGTCVDPDNRALPLPCAGRAGVPVDVPEPSSFLLLGSALLFLKRFARKTLR